MKAFARLYAALDETMRTTEKVEAMVEYFRVANPADAAWAVYFLSGGRPKRLIPVRRLAQWAMEEACVADWLFEESYHAVGDLAETMSLLLPDAEATVDVPLHLWMNERILPLARQSEDDQRCHEPAHQLGLCATSPPPAMSAMAVPICSTVAP